MNIRPAVPLDAEALLKIYAPFVRETAVTFDEELPTIEEYALKIAKHLDKYPWLVAEEAGEVIGYAYAGIHRERPANRWCVESSIYVSPGAHRGGVARRLYNELFDILQRQGYVRCYASITVPNEPSAEFHKKYGFTLVGVQTASGYKHGAWHDVSWWEFAIQSPPEVPEEPIPFARLLQEQ